MLSPKRLVEIRDRCEAAPPGPWKIEADGKSETLTNMGCYGYNQKVVTDTAVFISHARSDVPDLLDEIEQLREENDQLRAQINQMQAAITRATEEGL